jgi:hypothetical protein
LPLKETAESGKPDSGVIGSAATILVAVLSHPVAWTRFREPAKVNVCFEWRKIKGADVNRGPVFHSFLGGEIAAAALAMAMRIRPAVEVQFAVTPCMAIRQSIRHIPLAAKWVKQAGSPRESNSSTKIN